MRYQVFSVLLGLFCLTGCGDGRPSTVPVSGTVTVGGEPMEGVEVLFIPAEPIEGYARPSNGKTDAQGMFTVGTYEKEDGLPLGKYKIGFIKRELLGKPPENEYSENPEEDVRTIKYKWHTPKYLSDPNSSEITAEVTSNGLEPSTFTLETGGQIEVDGNMIGEP